MKGESETVVDSSVEVLPEQIDLTVAPTAKSDKKVKFSDYKLRARNIKKENSIIQPQQNIKTTTKLKKQISKLLNTEPVIVDDIKVQEYFLKTFAETFNKQNKALQSELMEIKKKLDCPSKESNETSKRRRTTKVPDVDGSESIMVKLEEILNVFV